MFRRKTVMSLIALLAILGMIAGCAPATPVVVEKEVVVEKPVVETVIVEKEVVVEKEVEKPLRFGFLIPTLENPFWVNCSDFAVEAGKALGVDVFVENFHNREDEELADLESLIARGIDGLLLTPGGTEIGPALLRVVEDAGIPVIVVDRWPGVEPGDPEYPQYFAFIGPNDEQAGYDIGKALAGAGVKKIWALCGVHGQSVCEDRAAGMRRAAKEFGLEVLDEDWGLTGETREYGMTVTENYLARFPGPEFDGIWQVCDETAMGSVKVVQERGLGDEVLVAGMDMIPDAMQAIKDGTYLFTTGGHWLQGGFAVVMLFDYMHGVEPTEKVVKIDLIGVTADNVDEISEALIPFPPDFDFTAISRHYHPEVKTHFDIAALAK